MFGIGFTEFILIVVVALIVIGPDKLPDIAKTLGKAFVEFKRAGEEIKRTVASETVAGMGKERAADAAPPAGAASAEKKEAGEDKDGKKAPQ